MSSADRQKRELANFEIDIKPKKKSGSGSSRTASGGKTASGSGKKPSASSAAQNKSASAKAKSAPSAKKDASVSEVKKKASSGTKSGAASSKKHMDTQKKNTRKYTSVEDNPLARRNSAVYDIEPMDRIPRQSRPAPQRAIRERDPYDDFDLYDEKPVRKKAAQKGKNRKKRKKRSRNPFSFLTVVLLLFIGGLAAVGMWRNQVYEELQEMKKLVSRQTFFEGTTIEGINVSQLTLPQALEYWETQVEPAYRQTAAVLNDGTTITAEQLGYTSDYNIVLSGAWNAGRSGSLVERYRRMSLRMESPMAYTVTRSLYNTDVVRQYASQLASQIDTQSQDASLQSFDINTQTFYYMPEQVGRKLNQEQLVQDITAAVSSGGGNVQMQVDAVQPAITLENVSSQYGMITTAVTNASSSSKNRIMNIELALSLINGYALEPGEKFSFNEVVGKRTKERGFRSAPAYSGGEVTEEIGGGICQVSTTLFNAAVKANMSINERHNHSLTVSYVDLGKDAAVDWGNKDLVFTNNSDDTVYICCALSEDKRVHIAIFGKLLPDGITITVDSKKSGEVDYETEYRMNFMMASGESKVIQKGKSGYSAVAYKVWWDAAGNEIQREQLCKSNYKATKEIVEYGP